MMFPALNRPLLLALALGVATLACQPYCPAMAREDTAKSAAQQEPEIQNQKFEPPQDIKVITKDEWSKATPLDAYYGVISSMLADNPHWQADATVLEMREIVRAKAGGSVGVRLHKGLTTQISRIAVMQVITRGDAAIVITIKEHKPTWQNKEATYSSDVFGFEKRGDEWLFNPRRSTFYPGCHLAFLGSMKPPINHYYCLAQDEDGYFTLDKTIQFDKDFNRAMFGEDASKYAPAQ